MPNNALSHEDKIKLCRIVGIMLLSDGKLEEEELTFFRQLFTRMKLDESDQNQVLDLIEGSSEVLGDVATLREHGQTLLAELEAASRVDGHVDEAEEGLIAMVREVLERSPKSPSGGA